MPARNSNAASTTGPSATSICSAPIAWPARPRPPSPSRSPQGITELLYQIQRFHSFLWASGGAYSDFLIHNIDECCWMKNAWPVSAKASGGRHYRGNYIDQNFDNYSVEYTFADGAKLFLEGRTMPGCQNEFASYAHGSRGSAIISSNRPCPGPRPHLPRPKLDPQRRRRPGAGPATGRTESVSARMERLDGRDPQQPGVQRGGPRRRGEPDHRDGPHGRPHRPGHHARPDAAQRRTNSPRRSIA